MGVGETEPQGGGEGGERPGANRNNPPRKSRPPKTPARDPNGGKGDQGEMCQGNAFPPHLHPISPPTK